MDFLLWQQTRSATPACGDALVGWENGYGYESSAGGIESDGSNDGTDFLLMQRRRTAAVAATTSVQTIPEPAGIVLLVTAILFGASGIRAPRVA